MWRIDAVHESRPSAHQRQVVLPADHRADFPERCVVHGERRAVAEAPHEALRRRRHDLAVLAEIRPVRREEKNRAVQRAAVALDNADHEMDRVRPRSAREAVHRGARHVDAALPVPSEILPALVGA
jgi:hypothetical protein